MATNKILTFVLTNHIDKSFIEDFYELENFIQVTNAILLLRAKYFTNILAFNQPDYQFRLVIHEGLANRGGYSRSESILTELEKAFPNIRSSKKVVFITRQQNMFPNQESHIDNVTGRHLNFNKCNIDNIIDFLPVLTKAELQGEDTSASNIKPKIEKSGPSSEDKSDFTILTALYDHEHTVFKPRCVIEKDTNIFNGHKATFREPVKIPYGDDYKKPFYLVYQEQMGLVDAAIHATHALSAGQSTFLIMAGVCGGRQGVTNLYDIIIPSIVHDYGTGKFHDGKFESKEYQASADKGLISFLNRKLPEIKKNMGILIEEDRADLMSKNFEIHIDEFACGPWVVKTEGMLDKMADGQVKRFEQSSDNDAFAEALPVAQISKNIKGLEMESYSIIRAGEILKKPLKKNFKYSIVVKSVMDFTNELKSDGSHKEVKSGAAYMSYLCVRAMMPILLEFAEDE